MDCVNHHGISAAAYCQNCGKPLCSGCVRNAAEGQILCEACWRLWQSYQQPFATPSAKGPNPWVAGSLGVIPGVGAMYNGQFLKGFIHVIVFAVLISCAGQYPIFGLFIAAWVLYQIFEAYHTARAQRDGQPLPDPFGLNEVSNWLNLGARPRNPTQPGAGQPPVYPGFTPPGPDATATAGPSAGSYPNAAAPQPPFQTSYPQIPYRCLPCAPFRPVGAVVLIGLGLLFLMGQLDLFRGRFFSFAWPLALIALGVWLIIRRIQDSQGGSK